MSEYWGIVGELVNRGIFLPADRPTKNYYRGLSAIELIY
jgi:hypothetical protein